MRLIGLVGKRGSGKSTIANGLALMEPNVRVVAFADPIKQIVSSLYDADITHYLWGESEDRDFVVDRDKLVGNRAPEFMRRMIDGVLDDFVHVDGSRVDDLITMLRDLQGEFPVREAILRVGQWGRAIDHDFWIRIWYQTVSHIFAHNLAYVGSGGLRSTAPSKMPPFVVVPDVRFPREANAIHDLGGLTIRVERDNTGVIVHELDGSVTKIPKPTQMIDYDITETAQDDIRADLVLENDSNVADVTQRVRRLIS